MVEWKRQQDWGCQCRHRGRTRQRWRTLVNQRVLNDQAYSRSPEGGGAPRLTTGAPREKLAEAKRRWALGPLEPEVSGGEGLDLWGASGGKLVRKAQANWNPTEATARAPLQHCKVFRRWFYRRWICPLRTLFSFWLLTISLRYRVCRSPILSGTLKSRDLSQRGSTKPLESVAPMRERSCAQIVAILKKQFMQSPATLWETRGRCSRRAAQPTSRHPLYARVNAKLKMSAMNLFEWWLSFCQISFFFFFCCQSENGKKR